MIVYADDAQFADVVPRPHPAKFSASVLVELATMVDKYRVDSGMQVVLDPFAGVGRIQELELLPYVTTVGIEMEPEWAIQAQRPGGVVVGNANIIMPIMLMRQHAFTHVVTSPAYGNRMADHHEARDASERNTYTHKLGRKINSGSSAVMQWGDEYRLFHRGAWRKAINLLVDGGYFVLNVSDHIRKGEVVPVALWHANTIEQMGMVRVEARRVDTPRQRRGENGNLRVDGEMIYVFRKLPK